MITYDRSAIHSGDNATKQNSSATTVKISRGVFIFVLMLCLYAFRSGDLLRYPSITPYFVYLADSFRHGAVDIPNPPSEGYELIRYDEHWYVAEQPLPALLMIPLVGLLGIHNVSDVAISVLCGALSVALADWVLGLTTPNLDSKRRNWLILFLALGTVHLSVSVMGMVWYLGQIAAVMFVWVFIGGVWQNRPLLAGSALGLILLGRPSIVPGALLFAAARWFFYSDRSSRRQTLTLLIQFSAPILLAGGFLGWYNTIRFGSPFEFGYQYIKEDPYAKERFLQYGNFSPAFFPENLFTATIKPPLIRLECLFDPSCPFAQLTLHGMGFLWTSPVLLYAVLAFRQDKERRQKYWLAAATLAALLPALLYHSPGGVQFGYRYLLDALPFGMILVAHGVQRQRLVILAALVIYCVVFNWWGAVRLIEFIT